MNNIENDSTFFVSIERRKVNQNTNYKNKKPKYFVKSIKIKSNNNSKNNLSFLNQSNTKKNNSNLFKNEKKVNNIPNLKIQNNNVINKAENLENKQLASTLYLPYKKKIDDDLELNIDDTDEYNNNHFQININKSKSPLYNMSYFENKSELDQNININVNSQIIKSKKNYHGNYKVNKNRSCCFENTKFEKWKIKQKIATANTKIEMLKNLLKRRQKEILELQIFFEKNNCHRKVKKIVSQSDISGLDLKKQIFKLKMQKLNCDEKYINKKESEEEINKENFLFSNLKTKLIEKILDYKILIVENNTANELLTYNDEATIVNDSYIFDKYLNTLEDKFEKENKENKENNLIEIKNIEQKNISLNNVTEEDDTVKINFNELNCFKNKNTTNYFTTNFCVKTKATNKNIPIGRNSQNSKFNIIINRNKIK